jgi:hypothetical protein
MLKLNSGVGYPIDTHQLGLDQLGFNSMTPHLHLTVYTSNKAEHSARSLPDNVASSV